MSAGQGRVQRLSGAVPDLRRPHRGLRPLCQPGRDAGARRSGGAAAPRAGERRARTGALRAPGTAEATVLREPAPEAHAGDWDGDLLLADEVFVTGVGLVHHLSRLQAGALHRRFEGAGRRHGHGGHRGHLQLLQLQGEDRHRPLSGRRAGQRALQGRGRRPCHHGGVRLADAVARRRASPHGRQQEGRPCDAAS